MKSEIPKIINFKKCIKALTKKLFKISMFQDKQYEKVKIKLVE